jgi:hypothetical protein
VPETRKMTKEEVDKLGLSPEQCEALGIEVQAPNGGGTGKTMTLIVDAGDEAQIKRAMAFGFTYEELTEEEGEGEGGKEGEEEETEEEPKRKGYFKD